MSCSNYPLSKLQKTKIALGFILEKVCSVLQTDYKFKRKKEACITIIDHTYKQPTTHSMCPLIKSQG